MIAAPQIGDIIRMYKPGMVGGYETAVISAAFSCMDDARVAGFTVDTGYPGPDETGDYEDWRVFSTYAPFGKLKDYAVVTA